MLEPIPQAKLDRGEAGLVPEGDGWFVVNVADAEALRFGRFGVATTFEGPHRFPQFGINVHVLQPGQPNGLYHRESNQEDFVVLSGECIAVVEEEEHRLRKGDLLHCPPGTAHVIVGAGDGPSAVLMVGTRDPGEEIVYPVSEAAARHGASVAEETTEARAAYAAEDTPAKATLDMPW